jgi:EAL domain-containing protein (putative c-di-GMP-specific phosphodiesterase class I)
MLLATSSSAGPADPRLLARLRRALAEDLFVLHFQPIVSLADQRVARQEALLRLADDPSGDLVGPAAFLPSAERGGLIGEIDRWVLEKVAALLGARGGGAFAGEGIAANVSALSASDPSLLADVARLLDRYEVDPSLLVIEITETAAIPDTRAARRFCAGLLQLGCGVALDDFGAGYGAFHYLRELPFTYLKIDGEFIRRLPHSHVDQLIVQALSGIAAGMGRRTVAECVGDQQTVALLRAYGVEFAQGFELGRPRPLLAAAA